MERTSVSFCFLVWCVMRDAWWMHGHGTVLYYTPFFIIKYINIPYGAGTQKFLGILGIRYTRDEPSLPRNLNSCTRTHQMHQRVYTSRGRQDHEKGSCRRRQDTLRSPLLPLLLWWASHPSVVEDSDHASILLLHHCFRQHSAHSGISACQYMAICKGNSANAILGVQAKIPLSAVFAHGISRTPSYCRALFSLLCAMYAPFHFILFHLFS